VIGPYAGRSEPRPYNPTFVSHLGMITSYLYPSLDWNALRYLYLAKFVTK
jgi:hypothetical protein